MDRRRDYVVSTSNFSCHYCKLLWTLLDRFLYPLKKHRGKLYCRRCYTEEIRYSVFHPELVKVRSLLPYNWPKYTMLINEAYCCYCPGKLCRNNVKLSECSKGMIVVHRFDENHCICIKCVTKVITDYIRIGFTWRCSCKLPNHGQGVN